MTKLTQLKIVEDTAPKSCFVFRALNQPPIPNIKPFRDPFGLCLAGKLVEQLRAEGFKVTNAKPGKACDAGCRVMLPGFSLEIVLLVSRAQAATECVLYTWPTRSLFHCASSQSFPGEWSRVYAAIERILQRDPDVESLMRSTFKEIGKKRTI